ncbi:MAG: class I SAM-dependent methyltransferase [Lysobacteraceae bacterium]
MSSRTRIGIDTPDGWDAEWARWFERYSRGIPRVGMWLARAYATSGCDILELGAGSGRESRFLSRYARSVTCVDFSAGAMEALRASHPPSNLRALTMDALNLEFPDRAFDLSFHKGFWSCFSDDVQVARLFSEQLRVTRRTMLALVHNGANAPFHAMFQAKAETDKLYQVRFFKPDELLELAHDGLAKAGVRGSVRLHGFGGVDWMHQGLGARFPASVQGSLAALAYRLRPLRVAESLVLEVTPDPHGKG